MEENGRTAMRPKKRELKRKSCATFSTRSLNTMSTGLRNNAYGNRYDEAITSLRRQLEILDVWA